MGSIQAVFAQFGEIVRTSWCSSHQSGGQDGGMGVIVEYVNEESALKAIEEMK